MIRLSVPPNMASWTLRDVRVPACLLDRRDIPADAEGLAAIDLVVAGGVIEQVHEAGSIALEGPAFVGPAIVTPAYIDAHTHLDKGHISRRAPNRAGTFDGAIEAVPIDRGAHWSAADVMARMEFGLAAAYAYGTRAIRTHLDSSGSQTRISWPVFAECRDRWRGRIDLHASPLFPIDAAQDDDHMRDVTDMVGEFGDCLGAATFPVPSLKSGLERLFRLASDKGWDLDFHADETNDPSVNALALIAQLAIDHRFQGQILVGHCCTLSLLSDDERKRTIDLVARAGIAIVSLPLCNMYLQDRTSARTPRWRGVTALHELKQAGVPVVIASDNTRDPFYAYGDLDVAEVWREGTRILQLDHPFGDWADVVTRTPAEVLRLDVAATIIAGSPADFIVFHARSLSELMARPGTTRTVVRHGRPIEATVPDFASLDHLEGLRP